MIKQINDDRPSHYAGFWRRLAAGLIDTAVLFPVSALIGLIFHGSIFSTDDFSPTDALFLFIELSYFVLLQSSSWQTTVGGWILGFKITDYEGNRISLLRALLRELAAFVSVVLLGVGFFMIGWTKKKQGLHDFIAKTLVKKTR